MNGQHAPLHSPSMSLPVTISSMWISFYTAKDVKWDEFTEGFECLGNASEKVRALGLLVYISYEGFFLLSKFWTIIHGFSFLHNVDGSENINFDVKCIGLLIGILVSNFINVLVCKPIQGTFVQGQWLLMLSSCRMEGSIIWWNLGCSNEAICCLYGVIRRMIHGLKLMVMPPRWSKISRYKSVKSFTEVLPCATLTHSMDGNFDKMERHTTEGQLLTMPSVRYFFSFVDIIILLCFKAGVAESRNFADLKLNIGEKEKTSNLHVLLLLDEVDGWMYYGKNIEKRWSLSSTEVKTYVMTNIWAVSVDGMGIMSLHMMVFDPGISGNAFMCLEPSSVKQSTSSLSTYANPRGVYEFVEQISLKTLPGILRRSYSSLVAIFEIVKHLMRTRTIPSNSYPNDGNTSSELDAVGN